MNTPIERASAPISSPRSLNGTSTEPSPSATATVTRVMAASGLATLRMITIDAGERQQYREAGEYAERQRRPVDFIADEGVGAAGTVGIEAAQFFELFAERFAGLHRLVLLEPGLRGAPAQLARNAREVGHRARKRAMCTEIRLKSEASWSRIDSCQSARTAAHIFVDLGEFVLIVRRRGRICRRRDLLHLHDRGIEQAVEALEIPASGIVGFEIGRQRRVVPRIRDRHHRQRDGDGGHQCEDRIELGGDGKFRKGHDGPPVRAGFLDAGFLAGSFWR